MKTPPTNHISDEEALTRFIDGEVNAAAPPAWLEEKLAANQLGNLLRSNLPRTLEIPSEDFFTSQIMAKIAEDSPPVQTQSRVEKAGFFQRFNTWLLPLTTAAAVLVVGGIMLKRQMPGTRDSFAYTPLANVTASLAYDDNAEATVINLDGLEAIPDDQDVKAFDVASSEPAGPGEPQKFFAANDPSKVIFVLFPGDNQAPKIQEIH